MSRKAPKEFHSNAITSVKMLSNGYVASSSKDKTVNVWDPNTWSSIQVYKGHTNEVYGMDQIDDDTMVSGGNDTIVNIWKISTGANIRRIDVGQTVYSLTVLLNRFQFVVGVLSTFNNLRIYNSSSGNLVKTLNGHSDFVFSVEVLNEQYIASGSKDKKVIIWDLRTYFIKFTLIGHSSFLTCVKRLSINLLASADESGSIVIWNWSQGTLIQRLRGHTNAILFSSLDLYDNRTIISGSRDKTIKLWNLNTKLLNGTIFTSIEIGTLAVIKINI